MPRAGCSGTRGTCGSAPGAAPLAPAATCRFWPRHHRALHRGPQNLLLGLLLVQVNAARHSAQYRVWVAMDPPRPARQRAGTVGSGFGDK
ncbi:hypothetical protein AA958_31830 [Streptomyces sp. CNQ-509]|nr:hypothetical protein AA958_31830 [Streptomyces sp. CNQ-509]